MGYQVAARNRDHDEDQTPAQAGLHVPAELEPGEEEAAVLSALAVRRNSSWVLVAGSLLTVPVSVARTSWKRWRELQPEFTPLESESKLDLGPIFSAEPFPGVRIVRAVVDPGDWQRVVDGIAAGDVRVPGCTCDVPVISSSSTVLLGRNGGDQAHKVVAGAQRPVLAVVATLEATTVPPTEAIWELATPPYLTPGRDLGAMSAHRNLVNWTDALVGITWPAGGEIAPPARFVLGRVQSRAWIAKVKPDFERDELVVSIAWDPDSIDPLSCSLLTRCERDGLPLLVRHHEISDFPGTLAEVEPWTRSWREQTLIVNLPRGPRQAHWGMQLLDQAGTLLDERAVANRLERIDFAFTVSGSSGPSSRSTIGDKRPLPSDSERDEAVKAALEAESSARRAAAQRRISTAGELEAYLRWRFSCRAGELLLLDPGLFSQKDREDQVVAFLAGFNRPIRALVGGRHESAREALKAAPQITAKTLPGGGKALHDRIWIVGEVAVLVGASPGDFLANPAGAPGRATTASNLPHADAATWREQFAQWWDGGQVETT